MPPLPPPQGWLIEYVEWSVADFAWPPDSPVWPDLLPFYQLQPVECWCEPEEPSCVTTSILLFLQLCWLQLAPPGKDPHVRNSAGMFVLAVFFHSASGDCIYSAFIIFCLAINWDMYLHHLPTYVCISSSLICKPLFFGEHPSRKNSFFKTGLTEPKTRWDISDISPDY